MPTVNLGRVKPIHRGAYNGATTYQPLDYLTYNGVEYHCIVTSTGNLPTDTGFFSPVVDVSTKLDALNPSYTGTLTGGTGVVNLGSGQFYKDSSGNVGLGTTSPTSLSNRKVTTAEATWGGVFESRATGGAHWARFGVDNYNTGLGCRVESSGGIAIYSAPDTLSAVMTAAGNLGLGVTPSAWSGLASFNAMQIQGGSFYGYSANESGFSQNAYYGGGWKYIQSGLSASQYTQSAGEHAWYTAPSGTAGNPISFTQALTLDAGGNLLVGVTNAPNGGVSRDVVFHNTSGGTTFLKLSNASTGSTAADGFDLISGGLDAYVYNREAGSIIFGTSNTERARIDTSGNLLVGTTSGSYHAFKKAVGETALVLLVQSNSGTDVAFAGGDGMTMGVSSVLRLSRQTANGRSISASGTINASGADYAEYERNNGLSISKGSIVGFKADGTLTLTFAEAVRFAIKSTNPSYVGGDTWGAEDSIGPRPEAGSPDLPEWESRLEAARQLVDRIAYSGKVPVNVQGATPGGYIVAVANAEGAIVGEFIADPDFAQYKKAVGRVNRLLPDGRCEVAVIIH